MSWFHLSLNNKKNTNLKTKLLKHLDAYTKKYF